MKIAKFARITKHILVLSLTAFLLQAVIAPAFVRAAEFQEGDNYVLSTDMTIPDDLFVAGNHVEILGDVEGDLFVAGNVIEIKGVVRGSAHLMGNYIAVHGEVSRDVMALGNQVYVDGTVGQDIRVLAGGANRDFADITTSTMEIFGNMPLDFIEGLRIEPSAQVGGDVHAGIGGTAHLAGEVGGEVGLFAGDTVTFAGEAARDVALHSAVAVILDPASQVGGKLQYTAPEPALNAPAAAQYQEPTNTGADQGDGLGRWAWRTLLTLGGFALALALSRTTGRDQWERIALIARTHLGGSILWGIVSLLAMPFLLLLLPGITWVLFGTPLAIGIFVFLAVGWFLCWSLSPIVSGRNLASYLQPNMPGEQSTYVGELLGVLLIVLIVRLGTMPQGLVGLGTLLSILGGLILTVSYILAVGGWIQSWMRPKKGATETEGMAPVVAGSA